MTGHRKDDRMHDGLRLVDQAPPRDMRLSPRFGDPGWPGREPAAPGKKARWGDIAPADADPLTFAVTHRDAETLRMVAEAVRQRHVALAFQPVMRADGRAVAFHEGLMRVFDGTGRMIPARDFMPAVETSELGRLIDCHALDMGLQTLREQPELRISVNMSARSIGYPRWMKTLRRGLSADPSIGERLILEITESSAMLVPELVVRFMRDLRSQGISFALDDFGSGYTSFRYLRSFLFDIIKIDAQFCQDVATDPDNQVLCRALISIGDQMDMLTIAEGVEQAADAAWFAANGVTCQQGYYFGAPTIRPWWTDQGSGAFRA